MADLSLLEALNAAMRVAPQVAQGPSGAVTSAIRTASTPYARQVAKDKLGLVPFQRAAENTDLSAILRALSGRTTGLEAFNTIKKTGNALVDYGTAASEASVLAPVVAAAYGPVGRMASRLAAPHGVEQIMRNHAYVGKGAPLLPEVGGVDLHSGLVKGGLFAGGIAGVRHLADEKNQLYWSQALNPSPVYPEAADYVRRTHKPIEKSAQAGKDLLAMLEIASQHYTGQIPAATANEKLDAIGKERKLTAERAKRKHWNR